MTAAPHSPGPGESALRSVREFQQAFTDAVAEAVAATDLDVWAEDRPLPWVQQPGGDGTQGYWITCRITSGGGTHLDVTYLAPDPEPGPALLADRAADLTLAGDGARDVRILAAAAVAAIRGHQHDQQRTAQP